MARNDTVEVIQLMLQVYRMFQQKSKRDVLYICVYKPAGTSAWRDDSSYQSGSASDQRSTVYDSVYSRSPAASAAAKSSFQNAVYIYSGKMALPPKQRPSSAALSPSKSGLCLLRFYQSVHYVIYQLMSSKLVAMIHCVHIDFSGAKISCVLNLQ